MSQHKQDQITYIKNQWSNYQRNFTMPNAQYCCAEGINSHYFSRRLSSRPKGFSKTNAHNLAYLLTLAHGHHKLIEGLETLFPTTKEQHKFNSNKNKYYKPVTLPVMAYGLTNSCQFKRLASIINS